MEEIDNYTLTIVYFCSERQACPNMNDDTLMIVHREYADR
jgi:hypothetical protein